MAITFRATIGEDRRSIYNSAHSVLSHAIEQFTNEKQIFAKS